MISTLESNIRPNLFIRNVCQELCVLANELDLFTCYVWQIHLDFPEKYLRICKPDDLKILDYFTVFIHSGYIFSKHIVLC